MSIALLAVGSAIDLLCCPDCRERLECGAETLACIGCRRSYPIRDGIPRFVSEPADAAARRTQASFGYEWSHFNDWSASGEANFDQYFGDFDFARADDWTVLDAGCGMGRHARQMAPHVRRVVAMDFSTAIDHAARNTADQPNVMCIQGDITNPPVADRSFDFVYSLGVLHHIADTEGAARSLVAKVKPGGCLRIYLYWRRSGATAAILRAVELVRTLTTRMPFALLKGLCWILSAVLFVSVVLPYRALALAGFRIHQQWPLAVYMRYPFTVLYNDQFDRFSAPIEQRWSEQEVRDLMLRLGLRDVVVTASFGWIAQGTRPR